MGRFVKRWTLGLMTALVLALLASLPSGVECKAAKVGKKSGKIRPLKPKKSRSGDDSAIPFSKTTRIKTGFDLTSKGSGFLGPVLRRAHKTVINSKAFRFIAEEKLFESVIGMVIWRIAFQWSTKPWATSRSRLLFTAYIVTYMSLLVYVRYLVMQQNDQRVVKFSGNKILSDIVSMVKKMQKGKMTLPTFEPVEQEMTYRDYDLSQVKAAFNRMTLFLVGMTVLHFGWKHVPFVLYWGMLGPIVMIKEPLFQVHLLGMDETGIRERPFGPKEEPEVEEAPAGQQEGEAVEAKEGEAAAIGGGKGDEGDVAAEGAPLEGEGGEGGQLQVEEVGDKGEGGAEEDEEEEDGGDEELQTSTDDNEQEGAEEGYEDDDVEGEDEEPEPFRVEEQEADEQEEEEEVEEQTSGLNEEEEDDGEEILADENDREK